MPIDNNSGLVLGKLEELRKRVGVIKARQKAGVRFKVRSNDELVDKLRPVAIELGLLIYPCAASGAGYPCEAGEDGKGGGTLASVNLTVRIQAVADGSYIDIAGFGLGADTQDKAGGKAGTYAFKSAFLQALLANGADDTDDTDTPIPGGVKKLTNKSAAKLSADEVGKLIKAVATKDEYDVALAAAKTLHPDLQVGFMKDLQEAKARYQQAVS